MITVYTAGGMEFLTNEEMTSWRNKAEEMLDDVRWLHPTRRIPLHDQQDNELETYNKLHRIVQQDLEDIKRSDIILADIRESQPGRKIGTHMEIALAWEWRKTVIAIVDKSQFKHPFVYTMCTEVHYSLEDAIDAVSEYTT